MALTFIMIALLDPQGLLILLQALFSLVFWVWARYPGGRRAQIPRGADKEFGYCSFSILSKVPS